MTTTEQDRGQRSEPLTVAEAWRRAYGEKLQEAISVLTDAARLARPRLRRTEDGQWVDDHTSIGEQGDWAEFVTLALAGAAANFGGVDAILAGRSGSWEAAGVRQVLESTVGPDEHALWEHRTEPLEITLLVDELLADRSEAWVQYDDSQRELGRRFEEAEAAEPEIDCSRYVWEYDRDANGQWAPRDPEGPAWSLEAWRASLVADSVDPGEVDGLQERLLETATGMHIPKSAGALAELRRLEDERDARIGVDLDEQLEQQRLREWTAYGEALKTRIEIAAASMPGLSVPVSVVVDVDTYRSPAARSGDLGLGLTLAERLIETAAMDTPTPEDLPGNPLDRLTSKESVTVTDMTAMTAMTDQPSMAALADTASAGESGDSCDGAAVAPATAPGPATAAAGPGMRSCGKPPHPVLRSELAQEAASIAARSWYADGRGK